MIRDVNPGSGSWFFTHPGSRGQKSTGSATLIVMKVSLLNCLLTPATICWNTHLSLWAPVLFSPFLWLCFARYATKFVVIHLIINPLNFFILSTRLSNCMGSWVGSHLALGNYSTLFSQCSGSVMLAYGCGSSNPYHWITDPDSYLLFRSI